MRDLEPSATPHDPRAAVRAMSRNREAEMSVLEAVERRFPTSAASIQSSRGWSRRAVRHALAVLKDEGLIVECREHGSDGWFLPRRPFKSALYLRTDEGGLMVSRWRVDKRQMALDNLAHEALA